MKVEILMHTTACHFGKVTLSEGWTYDRLSLLEDAIQSRRDLAIEDNGTAYFFRFSNPHLILVSVTPIDP